MGPNQAQTPFLSVHKIRQVVNAAKHGSRNDLAGSEFIPPDPGLHRSIIV